MAWTRTLIGGATNVGVNQDATIRNLTLTGTLGTNIAIVGPRPWADIRAFSAVGDGVTDDTTAAQAWLNAAASGSPLLASQGTYLINSPLILPTTAGAVIEIRGSGSFSRLAESNTGGTIFKAGASFPATGGMFRNSSATAVRSVTFKDLIIDGNSKAQYCLDLGNCFSTFLDNITVQRATSHGIFQDGTTYPGPGPVGRHVIAYLNGGDGVRISNSVAGAYFMNLFAGANTGKGVHLAGLTECWLTAPELDGNTDIGLYVNNSQKIAVNGGWIGDNGGTTLQQIAVVGASTDVSIAGVTVNKTTASNGLTLIQLDNVTRVIVLGNILAFPSTGTGQTCILVGAGSDVTGVTILGNTFRATTASSNGVSASDNSGAATLTGIQILGNVMNNATTPVYLGGLSAANQARFTIAGNAGYAHERIGVSGGVLGFLGATAVAAQTSGANLTNNVTSGGSSDVIADFSDLTVFANSAAAIRNDIYQLARKVKQCNDALRLYGLLT